MLRRTIRQRCLASLLAGIELKLGSESGSRTLGTRSSCRCVAPARLQLGLARKSKANVMPPIKQANRVDRGPDPGSLRHAPAIRPYVDFSKSGPLGHRIAKRSRFSASGHLRSVELYGLGDANPANPGQRNAQDMHHVGPGIGADPRCIPRPDVPQFAPALCDTGHVWSSCAGQSLVGDTPSGGADVSSPDRIIRQPKR